MRRVSSLVVPVCVLCLLWSGGRTSHAFYYGEPERFIEPVHDGSDQLNPDIGFDKGGNVHVVWVDDEGESIYKIFHRIKRHQGESLPTGMIAFDPACEIADCGLNYPLFAPGNHSEQYGFCVYSRGVSPYGIDFSMIASSFEWTYEGVLIPSEDVDDYAFATYLNHAFFIYSRMGGFRVVRMTDDALDGTMFDFIPDPASTLYHADICTDDAGYVYVVHEAYNSTTTAYSRKVYRSVDAEEIDSFSTGRTILGSANFEYPAIAATGSAANLDLRVGIGKIEHSGATYRVEGLVELNGNWSMPSTFSGNEELIRLVDSGATASDVDVTFGRDHAFHVVWRDDTDVQYEVYAAVSFDDAMTFSAPQCLSCDTETHSTVLTPRIASSLDASRALAITYIQKDSSAPHHPWLVHVPTHFRDTGDMDFDNWDTATGVTMDTTFGHGDAMCFRFESGTARGALSRSYAVSPIVGTVDFWFYDSLSIGSDFHLRIDGDDGTKASVYRMIGISNASSHTTYSVHDGTAWQTLSNVRTMDWHHVLINVTDAGIEILLDPETDSTPVYSSSQMIRIENVEFSGGTDSTPYHLDDVTIVAFLPRIVPAVSLAGIAAAVLAISALIVLKKSRMHS